MRPLRIVGPSDAGKTTLVERLVPRLAERGRVATVKRLDCRVEIDEPGTDTYRHRAAGAAATYGLMPEEAWFATGRDRQLGPLLLDLAPDYAYVLVEGYSTDGRFPAVVLGDRDYTGQAIASAPGVDSVDADSLLDALETTERIETRDTLAAAVRQSSDVSATPAVGTCLASLSTLSGPDRPSERFESALDACRATADGADSIAAVETHQRPGLREGASKVGFVAVAARTHADAIDTITDCGTNLGQSVPDASVELATTWPA